MVRVAIVGTGDAAHGLAHIFQNNNSRTSGNTLVVTKPGFNRTEDFHLTGVQVRDFYKTLERADVVILAIPAYALEGFIKMYSSLLQGKILVDPTNSWKDDEDLHTFVVGTSLRYVKAFNDIGAVDLFTKGPEMKKRISCKMCSPDEEALETVKSFAETSLGLSVKKVPFEQYSAIAVHQNKTAGGEEWMLAIKIMVVLFICHQIYSIIRYVSFVRPLVLTMDRHRDLLCDRL
jgi:predicted dinucleotide-binding enzyme